MELKLLNAQGQAASNVAAADTIFGRDYNEALIHQVVIAYQANARSGNRKQKDREEVHHTTKKPWRQKGTGRARAGSSRSPLWRSGAVIHGPVARDYSFKINKQVRKLALKMALSSRYTSENLLVVDKLQFNEIKTKNFVACKDTLGLKKALIVVAEKDTNLALSARNVPGFLVLDQQSINVYEILKYPQMVLDQGAVLALQERLK